MFNAFGYYDGIVIKDSFGIEKTRCSGNSCNPTISGVMDGYSSFDRYNGSSVMPTIEHNDGTKTECLGMFCERKKDSDSWGF